MLLKTSVLSIVSSIAVCVIAQAPTSNIIQGCVTNYDSNIDYFPEKINAADDKANHFTIEYHNNYKLMENLKTGESYMLVQCGTPTPSNIPNGTEVYQIPITKAAVMETSIVPYLEMIGAAQSISLVADGSLIASPCFQKYLRTSNVTELDATNQTLQAQQIDNVQAQFGSNPYAYTPIDANTSVTASEVYEPDVLGRASWISYYAVFYNREGIANGVRQKMTDNYNRLKAATANYNKKPVVAWTTYNSPSQYNNNTASYLLSTAQYKTQLTQDAGATILNSTTTVFSTAAELLSVISSVDILIDETYIGTNLTDFLKNYGISQADMDKYTFLKQKAVYREDGILTASGGYDWFEAPVVMADALLEDMINVVNPSSPFSRQWFRNIVLGEPIKYVTSANCTSGENTPRSDSAVDYQGGQLSLSSGAPYVTSNLSLLLFSLVSLYLMV
ncbi:hypothetical protein G6F60_010227 [Rhizopus arrhizus]|nr:hypothetical protein G6F60_010227 [Rhizopus arrhizus]